MSTASSGKIDAANLAGLLRRQRDLCAGCMATKLVLPVERIINAVEMLSATAAVEQHLGRCSTCGRTRWVMSLAG
jgi:hypothetical protein